MSSSVPGERDRWRQRQGGRTGGKTETGKGMQTERDKERCRQERWKQVVKGMVMSTFVSGQGFESIKEWKGGLYTFLLVSLLQIDEKANAQQSSVLGVRVLSPAPWPKSELTGPQSETVHWRSQGGPVQFFSPTGLVLGSHSFSSSEQRMSLVTTLRSPHLAVHCEEAGVRSIMIHLFSSTGHHPGTCRLSPPTTQTSPTVAHRPGCGMSCAPRAVRPLWPHTGHCTRSCQSQGTASSSSARCGTDGPHHRCVSTRSSCWSPTCLGSEDSPQWPQITQAKPDWKEVRPTSGDCAHGNPVLGSPKQNVG